MFRRTMKKQTQEFSQGETLRVGVAQFTEERKANDALAKTRNVFEEKKN